MITTNGHTDEVDAANDRILYVYCVLMQWDKIQKINR